MKRIVFSDAALRQKKMRILILLLLLGAASFFWSSRFYGAGEPIIPLVSESNRFSLSPLSPGFGFSGAGGYHNPLLSYPAPSRMRSFSYRLGLYTDKVRLSVKDVCADVYYVVLVYRAEDDYREQPNVALYNSAQACVAGERFSVELDLLQILHDTPGSYYYFIADQGRVGEWRDPR